MVSEEAGQATAICDELKAVRLRLVNTPGSASQDLADVPQLLRVVHALRPNESDRSPIEALRSVLIEASLRLPAETLGYTTIVTFAQLATAVFNLKNIDVSDVDGNKGKALLTRLFESVDKRAPSQDTQDKWIKKLREKLARALLALEDSVAAAQTESEGHSARGASGYVSRPDIEDSLHEAIATSRIVGVIGEGGVGKTTLVDTYANRNADRHLRLDVTNRKSLVDTARAELARLGRNVIRSSDDEVVAELQAMMGSRPRLLSVAVLDNVTTWDLIRSVFSDCSTPILFTSRRKFSSTVEVSYVIVGRLSETESDEMVRTYLPDATADELARLSCLRGRALAIKHVCAFLANQPSRQRSRWIDTLTHSVARSVNYMAQVLDEQSLGSIYREILAGLRGDPDTAQAVDVLLLIAHIQQYDAFRAEYLIEKCMFALSGSWAIGELAWKAAKAILIRYQLITIRGDSALVHSLTMEILLDIIQQDPAPTYGAILNTLDDRWFADHKWDAFTVRMLFLDMAADIVTWVESGEDSRLQVLRAAAERIKVQELTPWPFLEKCSARPSDVQVKTELHALPGFRWP